MEDIDIQPVAMGRGEALFSELPPDFSDPMYLLGLVILSIFIVLIVLAFMDAGPFVAPLSKIKTTLMPGSGS